MQFRAKPIHATQSHAEPSATQSPRGGPANIAEEELWDAQLEPKYLEPFVNAWRDHHGHEQYDNGGNGMDMNLMPGHGMNMAWKWHGKGLSYNKFHGHGMHGRDRDMYGHENENSLKLNQNILRTKPMKKKMWNYKILGMSCNMTQLPLKIEKTS